MISISRALFTLMVCLSSTKALALAITVPVLNNSPAGTFGSIYVQIYDLSGKISKAYDGQVPIVATYSDAGCSKPAFYPIKFSGSALNYGRSTITYWGTTVLTAYFRVLTPDSAFKTSCQTIQITPGAPSHLMLSGGVDYRAYFDDQFGNTVLQQLNVEFDYYGNSNCTGGIPAIYKTQTVDGIAIIPGPLVIPHLYVQASGAGLKSACVYIQ